MLQVIDNVEQSLASGKLRASDIKALLAVSKQLWNQTVSRGHRHALGQARRDYMRDYMRAYRARKRAASQQPIA